MENEEKRMISSYEVIQSIHIGKKEVVFWTIVNNLDTKRRKEKRLK